MRRNRNCLWFERLDSPKTSRYFSLSCPTVMWRRASISSRRAVDLLVSVFIVLTTSDMRPRFLGTVNFVWLDFREAQSQVRVCENGGDYADCFGRFGILFVHERSPCEATHDHVRLAVDAPSGGNVDADLSPCPLTIYAQGVETVPDCSADFLVVRVACSLPGRQASSTHDQFGSMG